MLVYKKKIGPKSKMAQISTAADQKPETTIVTKKKSRNFSCVLCKQDCHSAVGVVVHYSTEHPGFPKTHQPRVFGGFLGRWVDGFLLYYIHTCIKF